MKLSLITSSLIALSAAAPAFEDRRTYPAGLRSPLSIVKRAVELEPPVVSPVVAARFVSQGGGMARPGQNLANHWVKARSVSHGGSGSAGHQEDEGDEVEEAEDAPLAARFVSQGGGMARPGQNLANHWVKARSVSQGGSGSAGHQKRDMEARENHGGYPQGHKNGFTQSNRHGGNQGGNPAFNFNQQQTQPQVNQGGNSAFNFNRQQQTQPQGNQGGNSAFNFNRQQQKQPQANNVLGNQNGLQLGEAKIQINGQETGVAIGQPILVSVNGPQILSMSTNQGGCLPFSVASNGLPGSAIVRGAFGGGRSFQAGNGVDPILVNNQQILVWCSPNNLPLNLLQAAGF